MKTVKSLLMFTMVIMCTESCATLEHEQKEADAAKRAYVEINGGINSILERCGSRDGFETIKQLMENESMSIKVENGMKREKLFVPKGAFSVIEKFALVFWGTSDEGSVREFGREFRKSKQLLSLKSAGIMQAKIMQNYTGSSS